MALLLASVPGALQAQPPLYSIKSIHPNGATSSQGNAINIHGHVAGTYVNANGISRAFIWNGHDVIDLGDLGGGESYSFGINASGQVTGTSRTASGAYSRFIWHNGTIQALPIITSSINTAGTINDHGHVTGHMDSGAPSRQVAFLWDGSIPLPLGGVNGGQSFGSAINLLGHITGTATVYSPITARTEYQAFYWNGTSTVPIGTLGRISSYGSAINDAGHIAGSVIGDLGGQSGNLPGRAFLWNGQTMHDLGTVYGSASTGLGINNLSHVVGYCWVGYAIPAPPSHAFFWDGSTMWDLNDRLALNPGWTVLNEARAINDVGQITGTGYTSGQFHAFLLTPASSGTYPTIISQPTASLAVNENASITLEVMAQGTPPLTYQWYKNDILIPGASNATYTIATTTLTDAGIYTVSVTNPFGTIRSTPSSLTVIAAPSPPVIFVPGIGGSELWQANAILDTQEWPNEVIMEWILWSGGGSVNDLQFNDRGEPNNSNSLSIYAKRILSTFKVPPQNPFKTYYLYNWDTGIRQLLLDNGLTVVPFPYDFRYFPAFNSNLLRAEIARMCPRPEDRVDIVAHSMGGLVVLDYLQRFHAVDKKVRRFVSLGTPYLGATMALQTLRAGTGLGNSAVDASFVKRAAHNWPGLYALLPSPRLQNMLPRNSVWAYYEDVDSKAFTYEGAPWLENTLATRKEPEDPSFNPMSINDPPPRLTLSSSTLGKAFAYISERDNAGLPADVETLVVHGTITDERERELNETPQLFYEYPVAHITSNIFGFSPKTTYTWHYYMALGPGDGTVPRASATGLSGSYWESEVPLLNEGHNDLVHTPKATKEVVSFLKSKVLSPRKSRPNSPGYKMVIAQSPVEMLVKDSSGRTTSIGIETSLKEIPSIGAHYFGKDKALTIPEDSLFDIFIYGKADGSASFIVHTVSSHGSVLTSEVWKDLQVTPTAVGRLNLNSSVPKLEWDANGDGLLEYAAGPDSDGDRVPDSLDGFPDTPRGAIVDSQGGALAQRVPMSDAWRNQGEYVAALTQAAQVFVQEGLMTTKQKAEAVSVGAIYYAETRRSP